MCVEKIIGSIGVRGSGCWLLVSIIGAVLSLTGCSNRAEQVLEQMAAAYRSADRYVDDGVVTFNYKQGDSVVDRTVPFRVAFERPDRLRLDCYDASVVVDGTTLRAAVGSVPGQVLTEPLRSPLSLDQLFEDETLQGAITDGDAGCPIQLPLLLADDTLQLMLADALSPPRLAGSDLIEGRSCERVEVDKPDGTLVLWIDRQAGLLRRLSLPTGVYARVVSEREGQVTGATVVIDLRGASFETIATPEAFVFEVPPQAKLVESLEPVSPPEPPPETVGRPCPPIVLVASDGNRISRESLRGRLAVFEFCFRGCGPCRRTIPAVSRAVTRIREAGQEVVHHVVCIDEDDVSDDAIRAWLTELGGDGTFIRDPRNVAARELGVGGFPGLAVIGSDGAVADVRWGWHPQLEEDLLDVARADREGLPVRDLVEKRFEARLAEYERSVETASASGREALPPQVIVPRRQPDRLRLVRAWQAAGISLPGAVVRIDPPSGAQATDPEGLVVLDGWRTVVELGLDGHERGRHDLELPTDAVIGYLRSAVDGAARRIWMGWSTGTPKVYLFDADWKRIGQIPPEKDVAGGVADAELCDLDADGSPEVIVSSFGGGLEAFRLSGEVRWQTTSVGTLIDLVTGPTDDAGRRGLVCVDARGRIVRIMSDGGAVDPVDVGTVRMRSLAVAPVGEPVGGTVPSWTMVGIAGGAVGRNTLVGIDPSLSADWQIPLPDGIHRDGPVEPIAWADLLGTPRRQWIVAATDGSVLMAWADGRVVDRYHHGEPITGITGYRSGGDGFIVVATPTRLESLRLDDVALD